MADAGRDLFAGVFDEPTPEVGAVPERVRGFRVRVDLMYAKPPIWRRLVLPGDLVLDELHDVLQVAMGWQDGHLHKFGVGADRRTRAYFVTRFDLSEGDDGLVEDGVRLDQVVSGKGDRLFYDYDFGDGWEHVLVVEDVLDDPPSAPVCLAGKMACPPEDCGGLGGYEELAAWVRGGYDPRATGKPCIGIIEPRIGQSIFFPATGEAGSASDASLRARIGVYGESRKLVFTNRFGSNLPVAG
ncbi:plasmid pRiA4b ORF-3 family protein [Mycobacteroides abscessus]